LNSDADQLGSIANLTPDRVVAALTTVVLGESYGLDYPINAFDPPLSVTRKRAVHHIFSRQPTVHRDDYLDSLYLQSTSQVDGLRHARHPQYGFYNFVSDDDIVEDGGPIGVDAWAKKGIVGRGVLADIDLYLTKRGKQLDHELGEAFPVALIDDVLASQRTPLLPGDIVLLRTGWCRHYFTLGAEARKRLPHDLRSSGLVQSYETVEWLWDREVSVIATDNIAVEAVPPVPASSFTEGPQGAMMHSTLIGLLGLCLGELWHLDALASACATDGRYEFLVTAKPLNVRGGVGSPPNAIAIK
jgi:kynurenine formamidase